MTHITKAIEITGTKDGPCSIWAVSVLRGEASFDYEYMPKVELQQDGLLYDQALRLAHVMSRGMNHGLPFDAPKVKVLDFVKLEAAVPA